jgi:molybdopterin-guanine dinucleotide biosynthesis protein B
MKVIGLAGWSGAGKTTLLTRLIPYFRAEGLRVSVIKHAHHTCRARIPGSIGSPEPPKCWCLRPSDGR